MKLGLKMNPWVGRASVRRSKMLSNQAVVLVSSAHFPTCLCTYLFFQGHKRAPSDVSVASSEDEKTPLSPSNLESVPEKAEPLIPLPGPTATPLEPPVANHMVSASFVDEPESPREPEEETVDVQSKVTEETFTDVDVDVSSPETPTKDLEQLEISVDDPQEVDATEAASKPDAAEKKTQSAEESSPAAQEEEQAGYANMKVTLTLPAQKSVPTENGQKDGGDGKTAPDGEKDMNLSISSFLSKTKEPGTGTVQVVHTDTHEYTITHTTHNNTQQHTNKQYHTH